MGRNEDIFWNKITCIVFLVFFLGSINIFTSLKITYLSACDIHRKIDSKPWIISILWSKRAVFKRDGYNKESNATPNDFLSINFLMQIRYAMKLNTSLNDIFTKEFYRTCGVYKICLIYKILNLHYLQNGKPTKLFFSLFVFYQSRNLVYTRTSEYMDRTLKLSNTQYGGLKNPYSFTETQYFLELFYEIIFLCI